MNHKQVTDEFERVFAKMTDEQRQRCLDIMEGILRIALEQKTPGERQVIGAKLLGVTVTEPSVN